MLALILRLAVGRHLPARPPASGSDLDITVRWRETSPMSCNDSKPNGLSLHRAAISTSPPARLSGAGPTERRRPD
ncbi:MAG: hypothetical protein KBG85_11430 [Micropruina sp.]|nr:hypothetical protein [Micropruina sp.]